MKNQMKDKITQGGHPDLGAPRHASDSTLHLLPIARTLHESSWSNSRRMAFETRQVCGFVGAHAPRSRGASYRFRCPKSLEASCPRISGVAALGLSVEVDRNV
jgi:hypothetical protein